jgi:SNF2 family DNA or RNA helicase
LTFTTEDEWTKALAEPGSFQAADVRFLVESEAPLNGNQQGLGKTPEWIAAVWEGGWAKGDHLVVCPSAAVDGTWEPELEKWQADAPCEVGIFCCTGNRAQREETLAAWQASKAPVRWVVVNPEMIRLTKDKTRESNSILMIRATTKAAHGACRCEAGKGKPHEHYFQTYPELDVNWTTYCVDECHKASIRNHTTVTAKSLMAVQAQKRCAMSGTPSKKYGQDLWGVLSWLRPDQFTSAWRFWSSYFEIEDNGFGKKVLGLRPDRKDEFFNAMKPFMLRRTKAECLPWLPPKHFVPVWCRMGEAQAAQYQSMLEEGFATLGTDAGDDKEIFVNATIAEFTRLSQFANALCMVNEDGKVIPTDVSCKLDALFETMEEGGMFEEGATTKQVVFSQSREMIELVAGLLRERGLSVDIVSGKQNKKGERRKIKEEFQTGSTRVLCIVTQAGGVSLTLDAADVAHFIDESWAPDETEQAEDRLHRASRVHQVTIYQYRTKDTIDEYRMDTAQGKADAQRFIMDVRRKLLKEVENNAA